ncbi:SRPBCC family protein [Mucilaginibacter galii]|uniref:Activator of HSP90 ATPase n=1 Tax=Mucilaginibacter galii TaxID=2005073 RepID=A0A917J6R8_9SPHI|nr:SRPBCC family protein [Mucilaginibacter galii]GGI49546.1 activator of HSP90 ATPase [Mucilaginibacter galii]
MEATNLSPITVSTTVKAPVAKVWQIWTSPRHITQWCVATDTWHTPRAENHLRPGGKFLSRMEAKDGSMGFDLKGVYDAIIENELITYALDDGRQVKVDFTADADRTTITETFDPENMNPIDMQQAGWQSILDNFKRYVEGI